MTAHIVLYQVGGWCAWMFCMWLAGCGGGIRVDGCCTGRRRALLACGKRAPAGLRAIPPPPARPPAVDHAPQGAPRPARLAELEGAGARGRGRRRLHHRAAAAALHGCGREGGLVGLACHAWRL